MSNDHIIIGNFSRNLTVPKLKNMDDTTTALPTRIELKKATNEADFVQAKSLFREYIQSLNFELTFQDVDRELREIAIAYHHPTGVLLLAYDGDTAVACVGVRRYDAHTAELKRMFVKPAYRGFQLGRKLLAVAIEEARSLGYQSLVLDSIADMDTALRLYRSFGFQEIAPYRFNPIAGAVYMKKVL